MSSAPIGVMKASLRATRRARFRTSARCSASRTRVAASWSPAAQAVRASIPSLGDLGLPAKHAQDVRVLRQEPAQSRAPRLNLQAAASRPAAGPPPMMPAAGIVVSHATPISPTIFQPTWRQRRRPTPIPTTDGRDHLGGADRRAEDRGREDDPGRARLAHEPVEAADGERSADRSSGRSSSRRGRCRAVSATAHSPAMTQTEAWSVVVCPLARSRAAMIPTDFWASFEPWLNASHALVATTGRHGSASGTGSSPAASPGARAARGPARRRARRRSPRGSR